MHKLDGQVKSYIGYLREKGAAVNTAIVVGIAQGIVKNHNGNLLACNGGHLSRMGYVKRRGSTAAKVTVENFQQLREQFLIDIKAVVEVEEIPTDLIINWDQTGINYVPTNTWTMEKEGTKRVEIIAADDNCCICWNCYGRFPSSPADLQRHHYTMSSNHTIPHRLAHNLQ